MLTEKNFLYWKKKTNKIWKKFKNNFIHNLTPNLVVLKPENFAKPFNGYRNYINNKDYDYKRRRDNYNFIGKNYFSTNASFIPNLKHVYKEVSL